jgi:hypothetical protein
MRINKGTLEYGARRLGAAGMLALHAAGVGAASPLEHVSSVPEPGSLTIFGLALLGIWAVKRHSDGRKK